MSTDPPRFGTDGWDRIGEFMSRMNETGAVMAQRRLDVWTEISAGLRDPKFGADAWARSNARMFGALLDDLQDMASLWMTPPSSQPVANVIPTVFLLFEFTVVKRDDSDEVEARLIRDPIPDVPQIEAPRWVNPCPPRALLWLAGGSSDEDAKTVRNVISITRNEDKPRMYDVGYTSREPTRHLPQGSYSGVSYLELGTTSVPLADVRVVVRPVGID